MYLRPLACFVLSLTQSPEGLPVVNDMMRLKTVSLTALQYLSLSGAQEIVLLIKSVKTVAVSGLSFSRIT